MIPAAHLMQALEVDANPHGGLVAGYTAQFNFDPATKIGVIVLSNGRDGNRSGPQLLQALVQERRGGLTGQTLLSP